MKAGSSRNVALSNVLLVAVVAIIIIVAATGSYFLLFNKSSTSSTINTNTQSTYSATSSVSVTQSGSQISTSSSSSSTSLLIHSQYDLPFSSSNHTVFLFLIAQRNTTSEENYNLTNFGAMKIYVPLGWNISLSLYNNQSTPHSMMIVENTTDEPTAKDVGTQGKLLFTMGNTTDSYPFSGVPGGQGAHGVYTNNTVSGVFWLVCGVQGHGAAGMWAVLIVSSTVTSPHIVVTNPTLTPSTM